MTTNQRSALHSHTHHGVDEHRVAQAELHHGSVLQAADLPADGSGDLSGTHGRLIQLLQATETSHRSRRRAANLGVPVGLGVGRFDPAHDDLDALSRDGVELLRQLQQLLGLDLLFLSNIDESNQDGEKQTVSTVRQRQDLHPVAEKKL